MKSYHKSDMEEEQTQSLLNNERITTHRLFPLRAWITGASYVLSLLFIILSLGYPTDQQCTAKLSTWSPMLEAVEYESRHLRIEEEGLFSGLPSLEMEQAWDSVWTFGSVGIPEEKLPLLNKSSTEKDWTRYQLPSGSGVKAFIEGFHQLHCLNLIRQYSYRDDYDYSDLPAWYGKSPEMLLNHVEHCIEFLRIVLICAADATPYPLVVSDNGVDTVKVDEIYKCRRLEKLVQWTNQNTIEPYNATAEKIKHGINLNV